MRHFSASEMGQMAVMPLSRLAMFIKEEGGKLANIWGTPSTFPIGHVPISERSRSSSIIQTTSSAAVPRYRSLLDLSLIPARAGHSRGNYSPASGREEKYLTR